MQTANKNLMDTLSEIYEKEWVGQDMLYVQVKHGIGERSLNYRSPVQIMNRSKLGKDSKMLGQ